MKKYYLVIIGITISFSLFSQNGISKTIKKGLVDRQNEYRREQGAPDLVWSEDLENVAQKWADIIAKKDQLVHSNYEYGENIFVATYIAFPEEVVDLWAKEQQFYNGEEISPKNYQLFGHYTQMIWSATVSVGCAVAVSKSGNYYWVCEYDPPGNYMHQKPVENYKKQK